ncbi:MAG TPA: carbon-nitrogen hydrolase family protein [Thermoleophilia bacterium]|nr:carbon-nitrogen hydrolase family protein [Thermoleophilia bacterium]
MRVAAVQMNVGERKGDNVALALRSIDEAAARGARLIVLPELMTYHGSPSRYREVAEPVLGPTSELLAAKAREHGCFILGGSLVEPGPAQGRYYNSSYVLDPSGSLCAVYRKVHLFDVTVPGQVEARESDSIEPGDVLVAVELPEFILGMSICFDLRFPELYRALAAAGAHVLAVPAAFRAATGKAHWESLVRARAIENHAYVVAAAQWGIAGGNVSMHGHTMIVDPWGSVLTEIAEGDGAILAEVDVAEVKKRRGQIPTLAARRSDVYERPVRMCGSGARRRAE